MELRLYWAIIRRRLWVIVLVAGVLALYAGYQFYQLSNAAGALKAYQSSVTVRIALQAKPHVNTDQKYYDYIAASEALADELTTGPILTSKEFDTQLIEQIRADMPQIKQRFGENANLGNWQNPTAIAGALSVSRTRSLVTISVTWPTEAGAWAIAKAVGEVSAAHISSYLDYEVRSGTGTASPETNSHPLASAEVISNATDPPISVDGPQANRPLLLLVLLFVGLIIGTALAFLIEYLDDRIHSTDEVAQLLQLPIYGEIPRAPQLEKRKPRHTSTS